MKNKIIYVLLAATLMFASCNFLDVVPDDTPTLADAFANERTAEDFLFGVYSFVSDPRNWRGRPGRATTNEVILSGHWSPTWFPNMRFMQNSLDPSIGVTVDVNNFDHWNDIWANNYRAIRQANIFLDNIDNVRPIMVSQETFNASRRQWRGEIYFIIAWMHHELLINYGPIVIADGFVTTSLPRAHINDAVDFIVEMYDRAIALLPPSHPASELGRADATMAHAMRARLLLFAASPLFNGDPAGIWADADPEFRALINTTRDNARWERALTAIDEAINFAHANGRALFRHIGPDPSTGQPVASHARQGYLNVRLNFLTNWNSEVLWGHGGGRMIEGGRWVDHSFPRGLADRPNTMGTWGGVSAPQHGASHHTPGIGPTLTAAKIFYSARGLPIESDPDRGFPWTPAGRMTIGTTAHGTQTANLFINREPRFHAAIGYHGGIFEFNHEGNSWDEQVLNMFWTPGGAGQNLFSQGAVGGPHGAAQAGLADGGTQILDRLEGALVLKKTSPTTANVSSTLFSLPNGQAFPVARLAELYLAYAEAHAELHGTLNARARGFISQIHDRAGLDGNNVFFINYTGNALIYAIRRERMIELIFESHWHYDLRRWQMAYRWHNEGMWASAGINDRDGVWGLNVWGSTYAGLFQELNRRPGQEPAPILFHNRMHLLPIPRGHLNINELLIQNPGYD